LHSNAKHDSSTAIAFQTRPSRAATHVFYRQQKQSFWLNTSAGIKNMHAKRTTRQAIYKHARENEERVAQVILIKKSTIREAGLGAFTLVNLKRGEPIGYYKGIRVNARIRAEPWYSDLYTMDLSSGAQSVTGDDPCGVLKCTDGRELTGLELAKTQDVTGINGKWHGVDSNWTRFMNHAGAPFQNVTLCSETKRFGRALTFYANRNIEEGQELFFSYGLSYFGKPGKPPVALQPE